MSGVEGKAIDSAKSILASSAGKLLYLFPHRFVLPHVFCLRFGFLKGEEEHPKRCLKQLTKEQERDWKLKQEQKAREKKRFDDYWQRKANEKYEKLYGNKSSGGKLSSGGIKMF